MPFFAECLLLSKLLFHIAFNLTVRVFAIAGTNCYLIVCTVFNTLVVNCIFCQIFHFKAIEIHTVQMWLTGTMFCLTMTRTLCLLSFTAKSY